MLGRRRPLPPARRSKPRPGGLARDRGRLAREDLGDGRLDHLQESRRTTAEGRSQSRGRDAFDTQRLLLVTAAEPAGDPLLVWRAALGRRAARSTRQFSAAWPRYVPDTGSLRHDLLELARTAAANAASPEVAEMARAVAAQSPY